MKARLTNGKRSRKAGLPPGSLVHVGERTAEKVRISVIDYGPDAITERELASASEDRKSTRLNSSHIEPSRMPSSA